MEWLMDIGQRLIDNKAWQWAFSGIGLPVLGWLLLRCRRKPSAVQTFNNIGGQQNIRTPSPSRSTTTAETVQTTAVPGGGNDGQYQHAHQQRQRRTE